MPPPGKRQTPGEHRASLKNLRPPWKKGQSGNPRGRLPSPWRAWLSGVEPNARETLEGLLKNKGVKPEVRIRIAQDLLDRLHGRPKQEIEGLFGSEGTVVIYRDKTKDF
jgi:hypothetical protein